MYTMTAADLALLESWLEELSPALLWTLDDAFVPWLPLLKNCTRRRAVRNIIRALQRIAVLSQRLQCLAWLHCWLLPRRSIRPWHAIRFQKSEVLSDFGRVLSRTASVLRFDGSEVTLTWTLDEGTVFACLLVHRLESLSADHEAYYVALWPGLPLVTMFAPQERAVRRLRLALERATADAPMQKLDVPNGDLEVVFHACCSSHLLIQIEPGTLEVPVVRKEDPGDRKALDKDSKRRLHKWNAALATLGRDLNPVDDSFTLTNGKGIWVSFEGPNLLDKLRSLYMRGFDRIISEEMMPAFIGKDHVVVRGDTSGDSSSSS